MKILRPSREQLQLIAEAACKDVDREIAALREHERLRIRSTTKGRLERELTRVTDPQNLLMVHAKLLSDPRPKAHTFEERQVHLHHTIGEHLL